jgi:hypothetical protein
MKIIPIERTSFIFTVPNRLLRRKCEKMNATGHADNKPPIGKVDKILETRIF